MITILNAKKLANGTFVQNLSLDTEADVNELENWVSGVGFNYGKPADGSTAIIESNGKTLVANGGVWDKSVLNLVEKEVEVTENGEQVLNPEDDEADGYSKVTIKTNVPEA